MSQKLPFPCFICGERFKVPGQVGKHVEEVHLENRKKCVCDECGQVLKTTSGLIKHLKTHRGEKTYQCAFCTESFIQWAQRERHEKAHIKSNVFQCNECEVFFPRLEMLEDHNQQANCLHVNLSCCKQQFKKRLDYANHQLSNHRRTRRRRFIEHVCDYCKKSFGTLEDLQDHKKSEHKDLCSKKCPKCGKDVGDVRYACHVKKCNGRRFNQSNGRFGGTKITNNYQPDPSIFKSFCRICNQEFPNEEELVEHRKTHPAKCKTFICKICGNCCNRGSQTVHYLKHVGEKKFQCNVCNKSFYQKQNLTIHSRTHTKERPYKCQECGKTYAHPSSFREHVIFHSGERPYKCGYCPKAFFRYSGFQSHERTHTGEKPLECRVCGRHFAVHATLNAHLKRHFNPTMRIRKGKSKYEINEQEVKTQSREGKWVCEQIPVDDVNRNSKLYTATPLEYVIIS